MGSINGSTHPFFARGQIEFGSVGCHDLSTFDTHRFWHDQNDFVAFHRSHHSQANACITRCRFNNGAATSKHPLGFGVFDHGKGNPIFYAGTRISPFKFCPDFITRKQTVYPNVWSLTNSIEDGSRFHK